MALPSSGSISMSEVNVELQRSATALISMNDPEVRELFAKPSGTIAMSDGRGKSYEFAFTISAPVADADLETLATNAGWPGTNKVIATVAPGVYLYGTSIAGPTAAPISAGLTIPDVFTEGVELINNGFIIGRGGNGNFGPGTSTALPGKTALRIFQPVTITNNSYIAGGGGGGAGVSVNSDPVFTPTQTPTVFGTGGGGAGGGVGGSTPARASIPAGDPGVGIPVLGGAGGDIGQPGGNGNTLNRVVVTSPGPITSRAGTGGGGGRVLPGTGGAGVAVPTSAPQVAAGLGGGAGGSGGGAYIDNTKTAAGGGGGGWGAAGGNAARVNPATTGAGGSADGAGSSATAPTASTNPRGTGGRAVHLNGNTVTWVVEGTRYGAIS